MKMYIVDFPPSCKFRLCDIVEVDQHEKRIPQRDIASEKIAAIPSFARFPLDQRKRPKTLLSVFKMGVRQLTVQSLVRNHCKCLASALLIAS
jgi:hypothetical protein